MNIDQYLQENEQRRRIYTTPYDPITGEGSTTIPRTEVHLPHIGRLFLPTPMLDDHPWIARLAAHPTIKDYVTGELHLPYTTDTTTQIEEELIRVRVRYDFEFWAAAFVHITDKLTARTINFVLNYPQRILLHTYESQRLAGRPIRVILVKARQWGGSTLTQIYMAWIQLVHKTSWNSVICAHVKDGSSTIKGMYTKLLQDYPPDLLPGGEAPRFQPFEHRQNISIIRATDCKVTIGSAESPESVRSQNIYMVHFSEVAMFPDTPQKRTADLISSIVSSIPLSPYTMVVMESTAKGEGDYFYNEYQAAKQGRSDKEPLFIPWYHIPIYTLPVDDYPALINTLTPYEHFLWEKGATLEAIAWYREKRRSYQSHQQMMSEFPSDDVEAFATTGEGVFDKYLVERLKKNCTPPRAIGEIASKTRHTKGAPSLTDLHFHDDPTGHLSIWQYPEELPVTGRYITVVDVGGRSSQADYSVILVLDRYWQIYGGVPEVVAQWYGHIDHDLLVWKAAQIATYYQRALLVIESNTLETENTDGDHTEYILDTLAGTYTNLYARTDPVKIREGAPVNYGFHTNRSTKTMIIDNMIALLRDEPYIERDETACFEYNIFERKPNGSFGAKEGQGNHDDKVMARMIGLYICYELPLPREIPAAGKKKKTTPPTSEAYMP